MESEQLLVRPMLNGGWHKYVVASYQGCVAGLLPEGSMLVSMGLVLDTVHVMTVRLLVIVVHRISSTYVAGSSTWS